MRIISFNINGLRASVKKGLVDWVKEQDADMYLFQEIKIDDEAVKDFTDIWGDYKWHSFSAQKKGYSGVATLSKHEPDTVKIGCDREDFDAEGRCLLTKFGDLSVMNLYLPSGTSGDHRQAVKDDFLDYFLPYVQDLRKAHPNLIIAGDYNIAHTEIDIHDPVRNKKTSGFLPHEREWMTKFQNTGMIDALREISQAPDLYTWWSYRARAKANNKGWRIDYHLVADTLKDRIVDYKIHREVDMSDHCPLELVLS